MTTKFSRPKSLKYSEKEFKSLSGLWKIDRIILDTLNFEQLANKVVNVVLTELDYLQLGYQIIVLTLVNKKRQIVERVAISKTKAATKALEETPIPFKKIEVPLSAKENLLVKAINNKKIYFTHDLSDVLYPEASRVVWREIQKACHIKTSMIYPIVVRGETIGAMIFSLSKGVNKVGRYEKEILAGFTNAVGIAVENVHLYRRLRKANKRLKEVSALKDEFVSLTSHELRTPLTAVSSSLATVLEGYAGQVSDKAKEFLEGAYNESNRLIRLVNNLLNISRIEAGRLKFNPTTFNLAEIMESSLAGLAGQAKEKKLAFSFYAPPVEIKADEDKVREILINVAGNAIKFTDEGSVQVTASKQKDLVLVSVEDTGRGIKPEEQVKLFRKFERVEGLKTSQRKGGTGLGLYICKNLIEGMGGEIWLKSEHDKGTSFFFTLSFS